MSPRNCLILSIVSLSIFTLIGCSTTSPHLGETQTTAQVAEGVTVSQSESRRVLPNGKLAGHEAALVQIEAVVDIIDYKSRELSLSTMQGESVTLVAGPEIRNFNQIQAGDRVVAEYLLAMAFEVRKPTAEELAASKNAVALAARAAPGAKPAAGAIGGVIKIATVESIDLTSQTVTLNGISPNSSTVVKAKYPENLTLVKAGDSVVITAVEGFATSVNPIR